MHGEKRRKKERGKWFFLTAQFSDSCFLFLSYSLSFSLTLSILSLLLPTSLADELTWSMWMSAKNISVDQITFELLLFSLVFIALRFPLLLPDEKNEVSELNMWKREREKGLNTDVAGVLAELCLKRKLYLSSLSALAPRFSVTIFQSFFLPRYKNCFRSGWRCYSVGARLLGKTYIGERYDRSDFVICMYAYYIQKNISK